MAGITHTFVNPKADGADATVTRPSDWNAVHSIAAATITEAMQVLADNTTNDVSATAHGYAPKFPNNTTTFLRGDGTYAAPAAAGTTLNGITAATGAVTIANANNTGIVWNWANTTNTTVAFTFGETSAATNGTSTSGVPNQVLLKLATLAASTQSPLSVYSRGNHVFSVSPTTTQMVFALGTTAAPALSWYDGVGIGSGFSATSGEGSVIYSRRGASSIIFSTGDGATGRPTIGVNDTTDFNYASYGVTAVPANGLHFPGNIPAIGITGSENTRWTAGVEQHSKGTADAVSYALNFRKARGTVASPTVITTGDDLATITGNAYVGATNTYQPGAKIRFTSTGTISDAANGLASTLEIWTGLATVAPAASWSVESDGFTRYWKGTVANGANAVTPPTTLGPVALAVQEWVKCYNASGVLRYMPLYG